MKQQSTPEPVEALPVSSTIDYATIELLLKWKREDATDDPELIRAAEEELEEFKRAMNRNRAEAGELPLFP